MVKYVTNLYLATKVSFFNDMFRLCQKVGSDYASVIETVLLDPRIGKSHYMVPGPDGDYGFGGHCFPKDLSAMLYLADQFKVPVPTLMGVHTTNQIVRQNRDWEQMEGRAVSNREESITLENQ
jgi:UDPglucose 6-dehydrogenase